MKIFYKDWNPRQETLEQIKTAEAVIREYQAAGYVLTLRQLYYQFVARGLLENSERSYKNLGKAMTSARMAGLISWTAIEDRNRGHHSFSFEEDIMSPIMNMPYLISFDRWDRQETYVEVWVEKEALGNVVSRACNKYEVPHLSCKGYLSASEAWRAGRRFKDRIEDGKYCVLIHLGDHDPSGIDMTRDNRERMDLFSDFPECVEVTRIALNMDQVEKFNPPPNPAKLTDSRVNGYIKRFGRTSWELDAIEPSVLEKMIIDEVERHIDFDEWERVGDMEEDARDTLRKVYDRWDEIKHVIED